MRNSLVHGLITLAVLGSTSHAQTIAIHHQPAGCVTVDRFPRLEVRLAPAGEVATARVVFQGKTADWYSVAMKPEGAVFAGVLPKPKKELKSFRYYIDVTGNALGTSRTAEFTTNVVDSASACKGKVMAGALASASVILQGPAGVIALPAGFASTGVVAAGTAAGSGTAVGAAGAGATGGGGGIGATALVLGGVAVAGGVAVVAAKGGTDDASSTDGTGNNSGTSAGYNLSFVPAPPGIDVTVCSSAASTTFAGFPIQPNSSGAFDFIASQLTPVLRVAGQINASSAQATLTCTNGARSGSFSASGANGIYNGTFEFGPSRGQVTITRR